MRQTLLALRQAALKNGRLALLTRQLKAELDKSSVAEATLVATKLQELSQRSPWVDLLDAACWQTAARQVSVLDFLQIQLIPIWQLPPSLARVRPCPVALFVRGEPSLVGAPAVGIVGSRKSHSQAVAWAEEMAYEIRQRGNRIVVSGGAVGVDGAAHRGALAGSRGVSGATLAYLGVASDKIYPGSNRRLFQDILKRGGALVSEHPPGALTYGSDHAKRNRFIAGQVSDLLIVEADTRSGTLSTARFARRYGVSIWVAPEEVGGKRAGLELLLKEGAAQVWQSDNFWAKLYGE